MEYRPKSNYSVFLSPVSAKMTFVEDDYLSEIGVLVWIRETVSK